METQAEDKTVQDIINEIEQKSKGGGYIYRGERKCNPNVSSKLYRDFEIEVEGFDIELVQKEMLAAAKKHTGDLPEDFRIDVIASLKTGGELTEEAIDFEILTDIQHYGGKTNLIDFTTDFFIALFFACDGRYTEDGRVILQKIDEIRSLIAHPRNPRHRVIVQKSVFIRPPNGFIKPREEEIVIIPACLKQRVLEHLRNYHGISTEVIYNDLHGFIKNQDIHGKAYTHFFLGFACQHRAAEATNAEAKREENEKAIEHYKHAINFKKDLAEAYNNRGLAYADTRKFDKAIKDFTQAIEVKNEYAEAYSNRGNAYRNIGKNDTALADYTKAIDLNPEDVTAYNNRGNAYRDTGDLDKAIQDYTNAIKFKPDLAEVYNNRGNAYRDTGDLDKAIQDFNTAIDLKPEYANAYNNRGIAYREIGDLEAAIADFNKTIDLDPEYAEAYNNRGIAYGMKEDFDTAIKDFTQAIVLNPEDATAYSNRGKIWLYLKEWQKAKADLTTAKDLGYDIIASFQNAYGSVEDFQAKLGVRMPEDIATLLSETS